MPSPGQRVLQLTRQLRPVLALSVLVAALGCRGDAESPSAEEPTPALATATTALAFSQVSAGEFQTCGVTADYRAYCWGRNDRAQLGDGTTTERDSPVPVAGGNSFRQVSAGVYHGCGITTMDLVYCWGDNGIGELGDGTMIDRLTPVRVVGGLQFRQVSAASLHTCGVTIDNRAYCWGANQFGQLGDGTTTFRNFPRAVAGGHTFRQVSVGLGHTCGVTPTYKVYCWGWNSDGQLGDGTNVTQRLRPALVAGGHLFAQVAAGGYHTCAVTTGDRAFCWGNGKYGQIGDGKTYLRFTPRAVTGGLSFSRVSDGLFHTCGETTNTGGTTPTANSATVRPRSAIRLCLSPGRCEVHPGDESDPLPVGGGQRTRSRSLGSAGATVGRLSSSA